MAEFEFINRFFCNSRWQALQSRLNPLIGNGDDCAVLSFPFEQGVPSLQAVAMDTLVGGVHFPLDADPRDIGHKALAVNLSDLAAMGATPSWFLLTVTLPTPNEEWLEAFNDGLLALAERYECPLIGGDMSQGPLSISVQITGHLQRRPLSRGGAQVGDVVCISGAVGEAAAGLHQHLANKVTHKALLARLHGPEPRIRLGEFLLEHASACIDISDGLYGDLEHICAASDVGAEIELSRLPISEDLSAFCKDEKGAADSLAYAWQLMLFGGDDYELCFTMAPARLDDVVISANALGQNIIPIGRILEGSGVNCMTAEGERWTASPSFRSYQHFQ